VQGIPRTPSGCVASQKDETRGCARFTRLTPGYRPCTPLGCKTLPSTLLPAYHQHIWLEAYENS